MHVNFAEWYAVVEMEIDPAKRQLRWDGVTAVVKHADRDAVEVLLRLTFAGRQPPSAKALDAFRQNFRDIDPTFPSSGNVRECQILAASCLVALMESSSNVASCAASAVATTCCAGNRVADVPMDLLSMAKNSIERLAVLNRERPNLEKLVSEEAPKTDFAPAAAKFAETADANGFAAAMTLAANSVNASMKSIAKRQQNAMREINKFVVVQDEELQLLWWLTGNRSWDLDCGFADVPGNTKPLVFAKELADNTEIAPGPRSIRALLTKAGLSDNQDVALAAVINATDDDWLNKFAIGDDPSALTMPIHAAIKRRLETGAGGAWIPGWAGVTQLPPTLSMSPLAMATLFYHERLLFLFG